MNNVAVIEPRPIKVDVVRIDEILVNTVSYSYKSRINGIIKDYLYIPKKKIIA